MANALWQQFAMDEDAESGSGVTLNYDVAKVTIRRAGGTNKAYQKAMEQALKPHRHAIQAGTVSEDVLREITIDVYARTIVVGWQSITDPDGRSLPCTVENITWLFSELPDFFRDIQNAAGDRDLFRASRFSSQEEGDSEEAAPAQPAAAEPQAQRRNRKAAQ